MADVTLADASDEMYVTKRDGNQEIVSFDKILKRIKNLGQEANIKINYTALVMKVIDQLYDGISTTKIDELSAEQCASMASIHTDYNALAGRISISNHHKNTTPSFVNAMTELYSFLDKQGNHSPLVSQELYEIVCKYPTELEDMIVHDRDYLIDYFGFKTLDRAYLTRINKKTVERPQYMWLRVAIGIHGDNLEKIRETYEYMSQKCFTHATPTLFNAGTPRPQLSSCFEKNTPVNTLRGPIPIKDVKIGDEVITHLGNVKKVVQCHENKIGDRKLYSVFIHKTPEFIVTEDHKLFVYDKKTKTTNWKEVRHLSNSDYIMIPNYNGSIAKSEINVLDVILKHDLSKNDNKMTIELNDDKTRISLRTHWEHCNLNKGQQLCVSKNSTSIYNIISIDNVFMKFLGIWFGDGHIIVYNSKKNNNHRIRGIGFTIHKDNEKLVDFCIGMKDRFGIENVTVHKMKTQNVIQVLYNCPALGILFQELYGKGFAGKKLPDDFYKYDTNLITSFLSGLITTDGCVSASGAITLCMANKKLMFDLYSLCRIHNLDVSKPNPVKCQKLTKTQAYCMTLTNLRNDLVDIWKTYTDDRVVKTAKKPYIDAKRICADGFKYLRFQKRVEVEIDDEHVYTLGVEDDHSYSINGIIAQNCFLLSMEEDSIDGIFNTLKDCALISKLAGGIGLHIHNVRAKGSHIRGTNGSSNGIVPMLRVFNNTAKYVDQCVHPETIIYTTTGPKQIQHCQQGETAIFNLNGTTEIIENVLEHSYEGEFLEIETMHSIFPLRITPEHPIYVLRDQQKGLNYKVITNRLNKNICQFEWIDAKELDDSDMIVYSIPKYEEDINHISEDDCYMYGIILGDGSMSNSTDTSGYVSMHTINKKPVRDFVLKYFEERLVKCEVNVDENTCRIRWNRSIHLPFRYNDFYDETKQKRVNHKWLNLPLQKSKFILKGLLDTDGCNKNELVFDSTSLNLIESVRFICMKMGILTSGYVRDRVGEKHETKRGVIENKKISYCLRIPKTKEICKLMEMQYDENVQFFKFFRHNDYLLTRVKSISSSEYKGVLYDLQMTTEHNYLLHNGVVHNGGGKRNGSFAIYLEPWHADIESFLQMRKNHGDEELKARDLFYALWIPDLFMERIKADENWTLMCPNECPGLADVYGQDFVDLYTKYEAEGRGRATVKARQLWFQVLDAQMETGTPYLLYKDACNKKSNQKNIGTIKSSNLCVAPETQILTDKGHMEIQHLAGQKVNVWNGQEFSEVEVFQTGENQELMEVKTDDGCTLTCTPYHKFFIQNSYSKKSCQLIEAKDLKMGDKLQKCAYPVIEGKEKMKHAYTHGFFCGDGTYTNNHLEHKQCEWRSIDGHYFCKRHLGFETEDIKNNPNTRTDKCNAMSYVKKPVAYLYGEKKDLLEHMEYRTMTENDTRMVLQLPLDLDEKFYVPKNANLQDKLAWFAGYCDADGSIAVNGTNKQLQVSSINPEFLFDVKMMLQTCGVNPKLRKMRDAATSNLPDGKGGHRDFDTQPVYRLLITSCDLIALKDLGFSPKRLKMENIAAPNRNATQFVKISSAIQLERRDNTFCFTEPKRHAGIFNGILTSQCTEVIQVSNEEESAVCNLASIALPAFISSTDNSFDFEKLHKVSRIVTYNLNRVIDINYYPTEKTKRSNLRHRPIGIGVQGLADVFMMLGFPFASDEARRLNKQIFETIYHAALEESCYLARRDGAYETFIGSPASQGILQYDMWNVEPEPGRYDWTTLKTEIQTHGLRNSLLLAPMPTASTSQILGYNECIEPITSNIYNRRTLAGEFILANKYLMQDLVKLDLWNEKIKNNIIANHGSVQHIESIPKEIREKYKTVWEIPMRALIDMAADRGAYVCQSQSLNLWLEDPTYSNLTSMHFYSWSKGLKTGIYYLRRRARHQAQQFTIEPEKRKGESASEEVCEMCSA